MRAIVTVIGKDKPGIIAKISNVLAENNVNIEDISQTVLSGNFTMLMVCDISASKLSIKELANILDEQGSLIGVSIHIQNEDIFNAMHKI